MRLSHLSRVIPIALAATIGTQTIATPRNDASPADVQRLLGCRSLQNNSERLACFDRQSALAAAAIERRDLVFIDRARARETRRQRFGLSVPDFGGLFGDSKDQVNEITSTVAGATISGSGSLQVRLADGSVWLQTDDRTLGDVRPGAKAIVKRGAMSSFWISIDGIASFKAKRLS